MAGKGSFSPENSCSVVVAPVQCGTDLSTLQWSRFFRGCGAVGGPPVPSVPMSQLQLLRDTWDTWDKWCVWVMSQGFFMYTSGLVAFGTFGTWILDADVPMSHFWDTWDTSCCFLLFLRWGVG